MDKKEKAKQRFIQIAESVGITFVPQCCHCRRNWGYQTCEQFPDGKPKVYMSNDTQCEFKIAY